MTWIKKAEDLNLLLETFLDLERKAVGVRFIFTKEEYEKINIPNKKGTMTYCTAIRNASRGEQTKLEKDNFACMAAAMALGIVEANREYLSGYRNCKMGIYKDLTVSRQIAKNMVFCQHEIYGVEIRPLEDYRDYEPNVVILITHPYNTMRISQAYAYNYGHLNNLHIGGMNAICQELTSYVHEKNEVNISMLCSGTRAVSQWDDSELGIGIPYNKLDSIIDGLINTTNPMDDNAHKKLIEKKLNENSLKEFKVKLNENYYRGVYRRPKDVKEDKKSLS